MQNVYVKFIDILLKTENSTKLCLVAEMSSLHKKTVNWSSGPSHAGFL